MYPKYCTNPELKSAKSHISTIFFLLIFKSYVHQVAKNYLLVIQQLAISVLTNLILSANQ